MKKRILSLVFTLALCLSLFPIGTSAASSDFTIKDVYVEGKHFTNVLTAYNGPGGNVIIPEGVQYVGLGIGFDSAGEGGSVFEGRKDIISVSIPKSAYAIGGNAFADCTGLTNLTIPDGVTQIANKAFAGCSGLTSLTIPGSVRTIGTGAFAGCTGLTSLTLCDGVGTIGGEAFQGCTGLTNVSFPGTATIESLAFRGCTNLSNITVPATVRISGNPFDGTAWWEKQGDWLILNGTLLAYQGNNANIVIPNNVTCIGGGWYQGLGEDVSSITIPHNVTTINDNAFWHINGITSITIPDSVTYIGDRAFADTGLITVKIPDSVTSIGYAAFDECSDLTGIIIPSSVSTIERGAFDRCPKLTIHGSTGSYAEAYAKEYSIPFVSDLAPVSTVGGFIDVQEGAYFAEPVLWAVNEKITAGTAVNTFSPNKVCTKAEILTFLWRSQGEPEPTIDPPYSGLSPNDYYYKAALWACETGLVTSGDFGRPCSRSFAVMYLWKLAGSPSAIPSNFTDAPKDAEYAQAVAWAVEQGITQGTSATTFSPDTTCTRGQIVTFLYRAFAE